MSKRLIDSSILCSPDLYDLGWWERYVVVALLLLTDDDGIACAQREYLRQAVVGPWRAIRGDRVDALLALLESRDVISSHMRGGCKYIRFNNFHKYQKLSRPRKSTRIEENRIEEKRTDDDVSSSSSGGTSSSERALRSPPWGFGSEKARTLSRRISPSALAEWQEFSDQHGIRLAVHLLQRYDAPTDLPARLSGPEIDYDAIIAESENRRPS